MGIVLLSSEECEQLVFQNLQFIPAIYLTANEFYTVHKHIFQINIEQDSQATSKR